ncbi:MAG TPA: bifunctional (p)ppGpp synthetase/guanosine-3',5'-bis(diphosphate) 3'-pyrophosphohydrolase [Bacteriovoracaceae bacterium]|nr:bifunctional (p)ppGpp synthetase/guanosine-3',5'-bis(diphosphate) 3'-pyrophosphohydrolase [Bacteriovoracaceae bacterium]
MQFGLDFSHERDLEIEELARRVLAYYPNADMAMLRKAYFFAQKCHIGQKRSSGEDYFIHPVNVAAALVKLNMDMDSVISGLLHDVVEDCDIHPDLIEKEFSKNIANIVIGLTKISKIKFRNKEESQAENFRKMIVAMAKDLRVIIVKLADRMHNMRTLQYISDEKQKKIAQETLDIYVPLASRLGINSVKAELEDLCLRFLKPEVYYKLAEKVAMKKEDREKYIRDTVAVIKDNLISYSMDAEVTGRSKHFYSIYKKMISRGVDFEQIQDVLAFRIQVNNITECYKGLGIIHSSFTPIPGRFKDYIAIPKLNGYQSLHTTVIGPAAERIEIQIRTHEMEEVAETGVAAHWKYKEGVSGKNVTKLAWVQELLEFNKNVDSNSEFMNVVKNDLDMGGIYVFTPKGEVLELRHSATPLDFAYAVHSEVGNHCVGAKVNGKIVPLRYKLKSGDSVEVLTSKTQTPSKDWLNIVKTSKAKTKIKQWLQKVEREHSRDVGEDLLEKTLRLFSTSVKTLKKSEAWNDILKGCNLQSDEELFIGVGAGKITTQHILSFAPTLQKKGTEEGPEIIEQKIDEISTYSQKLTDAVKKKAHRDNAVIVDGMDDLVVRIAKCCSPIPGDPIVGHITRGRGITVHTVSCDRVEMHDAERTINVTWNEEFKFKHPVNIRVITHDRPGMLSQISNAINKLNINIRTAIAKSLPDRKGSFLFEVEVKDFSELLRITSALESLEEVISVSRI